jgi:bifunctional DNA-binding transcriptional regulator/antitoxin component of YhaV-PrlF toxin-antitoxin module
MNTRVSAKGWIVLPPKIRQQDDIRRGQVFRIERIGRGEYRLVRCEPHANEGLVDWLLACPEKGFFAPIQSASTDAL